jgi:hypothetical protein
MIYPSHFLGKSSLIATQANGHKKRKIVCCSLKSSSMYWYGEGYDPTYAARLSSRRASKIISGIRAGNETYKITPYDHDKVMASVKAVLAEMERSE